MIQELYSVNHNLELTPSFDPLTAAVHLLLIVAAVVIHIIILTSSCV